MVTLLLSNLYDARDKIKDAPDSTVSPALMKICLPRLKLSSAASATKMSTRVLRYGHVEGGQQK